MKSLTSWKMAHVRSKTRSLCQILQKPYIRSRGHIFSPIIMKLGQNVCLDEISDEFENGSCWFKNWECPWARHLRALPSTGETQESMNNVSCRRDMTEILLKHHSINQSIMVPKLGH